VDAGLNPVWYLYTAVLAFVFALLVCGVFVFDFSALPDVPDDRDDSATRPPGSDDVTA